MQSCCTLAAAAQFLRCSFPLVQGRSAGTEVELHPYPAPSFTCDESGIMPKYDGHFTSLSVPGQETCQSKTPHWLVNPAHHPPSAPCSKVHSILGAHTSRLQLGGCTHPPTMPHLELHNSKVRWLCHYAIKQNLVISPYPCQ